MTVSDVGQARVFIINILFGMICVAVFDFFRALRRRGNSDFLNNVLDVLYFTAAFGIVLYAGMKFNFGALRYYQVMGLATGAFLQFALLSRCEVKIFGMIIKAGVVFVKVLCKAAVFIPFWTIKLVAPLFLKFEAKIMDICSHISKKKTARGRKKSKDKKILRKRLKML